MQEFISVKFAAFAGTLMLALGTVPAESDHLSQIYTSEVHRSVRLPYLLFLPAGYNADPDRRWPLVLYLHGGSLRGDDTERLRTMGLPKRIDREPDFPFIVVSPLCPAGEIWTDAEATAGLLDHVQSQYRIDADAVYATGHSMGGRGVLYMAFKMPERFAAVVAMSPVSPISEWAKRLHNVPLWIIHGATDAAAPIRETEELVHALENSGADVRFTRLEDRDHFLLDQYDGPAVFDWCARHRRSSPVRTASSTPSLSP